MGWHQKKKRQTVVWPSDCIKKRGRESEARGEGVPFLFITIADRRTTVSFLLPFFSVPLTFLIWKSSVEGRAGSKDTVQIQISLSNSIFGSVDCGPNVNYTFNLGSVSILDFALIINSRVTVSDPH